METVINDAVVISCHSRESGNPGTCKHLKKWIPTFAGMTNIGVIITFYGAICKKSCQGAACENFK